PATRLHPWHRARCRARDPRGAERGPERHATTRRGGCRHRGARCLRPSDRRRAPGGHARHHRDGFAKSHARAAPADRLTIEALLFGVGAAVAFGFGDYAAAMASRRAGVALTALGMQILGVGVLALVLAALGRWPQFTAEQVPWALALALVGTLSLAALYRA